MLTARQQPAGLLGQITKALAHAGYKSFESSLNGRLRGYDIELPTRYFRILPGHLRLQRFDPRPDQELCLRLSPRVPRLASRDEPPRPTGFITLERLDFIRNCQVEVTRPVAPTFSRSTRWKRHPPSKRRRMKSWRYAPDSLKLAHAPFSHRVKRLPWWALHPDANRRQHMGVAIITQCTAVYSQPGLAERRDPDQPSTVETLLEGLGEDWLSSISHGFYAS